jgi:hypothetical protein
MKMEGSGSASGSISQRHGSVDPDRHQNVMDPQHCPQLVLPPVPDPCSLMKPYPEPDPGFFVAKSKKKKFRLFFFIVLFLDFHEDMNSSRTPSERTTSS